MASDIEFKHQIMEKINNVTSLNHRNHIFMEFIVKIYFICHWIKACIKLLLLIQMLWYLADVRLDSLSINICCHIYNVRFVYENFNIFLSNYHIWSYRNLKSHNSKTHKDILFKFSGFSIHIDFCNMIEDWKPKLLWFQSLHFSE